MYIPEGWRDTELSKKITGLYFRLERDHKEILGQYSLQNFLPSEIEIDT